MASCNYGQLFVLVIGSNNCHEHMFAEVSSLWYNFTMKFLVANGGSNGRL